MPRWYATQPQPRPQLFDLWAPHTVLLTLIPCLCVLQAKSASLALHMLSAQLMLAASTQMDKRTDAAADQVLIMIFERLSEGCAELQQGVRTQGTLHATRG